MVLVLLYITIVAKLNSDDWQDLFLTLTIMGIVFVNAFSAVFQGTSYFFMNVQNLY